MVVRQESDLPVVALVADFRRYVESVPSEWWPRRAHEDAMSRRWELGNAVRSSKDGAFTEATWRALRSWKAFRGASVPLEDVEGAIAATRPLLRRLEGLNVVDLDVAGESKRLLKLFEAVADVKPTAAKWMSCSKLLHHLLPDLIVPMDNAHTPAILGRPLPSGLDLAFLEEAYGVFAEIARRVGRPALERLARDSRYAVPLGLARVIDFGIVGFARSQS